MCKERGQKNEGSPFIFQVQLKSLKPKVRHREHFRFWLECGGTQRMRINRDRKKCSAIQSQHAQCLRVASAYRSENTSNRYPNLSVPVHATDMCLFFILESSSVLVREANPLDDMSGHTVDRVNGNEARVAQQGQATDAKVCVEDVRQVSWAI